MEIWPTQLRLRSKEEGAEEVHDWTHCYAFMRKKKKRREKRKKCFTEGILSRTGRKRFLFAFYFSMENTSSVVDAVWIDLVVADVAVVVVVSITVAVVANAAITDTVAVVVNSNSVIFGTTVVVVSWMFHLLFNDVVAAAVSLTLAFYAGNVVVNFEKHHSFFLFKFWGLTRFLETHNFIDFFLTGSPLY